MDPDLEKCFTLINQTFTLAEYLSLDIFIGIEMSSNRRCWSSNGRNLQFDFMSNELAFQESDLWLKSGKIVGQEIVDKEELFNLCTNGLTVLNNCDTEVAPVVTMAPDAVSADLVTVKMESTSETVAVLNSHHSLARETGNVNTLNDEDEDEDDEDEDVLYGKETSEYPKCRRNKSIQKRSLTGATTTMGRTVEIVTLQAAPLHQQSFAEAGFDAPDDSFSESAHYIEDVDNMEEKQFELQTENQNSFGTFVDSSMDPSNSDVDDSLLNANAAAEAIPSRDEELR